MVTSSKNAMMRQSVEFVLGVGQVIKGFDRAIPQMSIGERSKITVTPEYGYGTDGLFPHIPANASLMFDLTLLGFRVRAIWVKPLIQMPGLSEKPYHETKKHLNLKINTDKSGRRRGDNDSVDDGSTVASTVLDD